MIAKEKQFVFAVFGRSFLYTVVLKNDSRFFLCFCRRRDAFLCRRDVITSRCNQFRSAASQSTPKVCVAQRRCFKHRPSTPARQNTIGSIEPVALHNKSAKTANSADVSRRDVFNLALYQSAMSMLPQIDYSYWSGKMIFVTLTPGVESSVFFRATLGRRPWNERHVIFMFRVEISWLTYQSRNPQKIAQNCKSNLDFEEMKKIAESLGLHDDIHTKCLHNSK